MTHKKHQPTLSELCIQFLCAQAQHFAPTEQQELELSKQFVVIKQQEFNKRLQEQEAMFGLEILPSRPSQELVSELCRRQRLTFPLLLQLSSSTFSSLNLCLNGRVRNEWMILIREMKLTHLNLSHCLLSNDAFFHLRKKAPTSSSSSNSNKKRKNSSTSPPKEQQQQHKNSPRRYKNSPASNEDAQQRLTPVSPASSPNILFKVKQYYPLAEHLLSLNLSYIHVLSIDGITCMAKECQKLKTLSLEGCKQVNNKCLEVLGHKLPNLTALNIRLCTKISNHGIKALAPMKHLEYLNVAECSKLTAEALGFLAKYNYNLMNLNLRCTKIDDISNLEELRCLRTLDMHGLSTVKSIKSLEQIVSLTSLNINDLALPDKEIARLGNLFMLKCLNMSNNKVVTPVCLVELIKALPELNYLDVSRTMINDSVLKQVATKNILKLNISSCSQVTDHGFQYLSSMNLLDELQVRELDSITCQAWHEFFDKCDAQLKCLDISDNFFETDSTSFNTTMHGALVNVGKLKYLHTLYACHCDLLDDAILKQVSKLPSITSLDLTGTAISSSGLDYLSDIPHLQNLTMREMFNIKTNFGKIGACTALEFLDLSACKVTNDDLKQWNALTRLSKLSLMNCRQLTSNGMKQLQAMTDLQNLNLYGITMTDNGVSHLSKLENVNKLRISDSKLVTDAGFDMLHTLPNLVYLKQKPHVV